MIERLVFASIEDNMVTFERENGDTIIYPMSLVSKAYSEGDIIKAIVHNENYIEFLEVDIAEMERRRALTAERKSRLSIRARQNLNNA